MLSRLFPKQIDNIYRGYWLAVWLLVPLVLLKIAMGVNVSGLNPWVSNRQVAITADGFALDSYGSEAASVVMFMFASWGLMLLLVNLLALLVLIRYRAMIPLMFLLLTLEQVGRKGIAMVQPIVKTAVKAEGLSPAAYINDAFLAMLVIGLVLSLATRRGAGEPADAQV